MDGRESYTHRGLTYPFGRRAPEPGEAIPVAPGILWARLPVPGPLVHVNVWLLEDGPGFAIVDTGLDAPGCRAAWEGLFAGPLAGWPVTRLIVTHFHPDHVGLAGWLQARTGASLVMTEVEWLHARMLAADRRDAPPAEAFAFWRAAGWSEARIADEAAKGWGRFAGAVSPIPVSYRRIAGGDMLRIGARAFRILTGRGHSPDHACLWDEANGLLVAGDQVLPRISPNVSLSLGEPEGDPLGDWLASLAAFGALPGDPLVLPGHGAPFTGLHARLDALAEGHRGRLDALHAFLAEPRRAVDCFGILFGRRIEDGQMGLATGESLAHLRRLETVGRARREEKDGVHFFRRA